MNTVHYTISTHKLQLFKTPSDVKNIQPHLLHILVTLQNTKEGMTVITQ